MAIDKRYLHYITEKEFLKDKNSGNIQDKSIAFISDNGKRAIYTHGKFYSPELFVVGSQTSSTNAFTGTINTIDSLYDGLSIKYWLPYDGTTSGATLDLTINGESTGAIPVFAKGTTRLTNQVEASNVISLTYRENVGNIEKGWWVLRSLSSEASDSNTTYTFTDGTDGSFKVTPSDGSEQVVNIGKPETAGTADKVEKKFTLQVNSGSTAGTNLFEYDGSSAKTVNIKAGNNISIETPNLSGNIVISGNYQVASETSDGLMSSDDKKKLKGISEGANKYVHPSYDKRDLGLYKISVDSEGHVDSVSGITKDDITALGIPGQDTDTKAKVTTGTTTKSYLVGVNASGYTSGNATDKFITDTGVYLDTTAGKLTATTFAGNLDGTISPTTTAVTAAVSDSSTKVATTEFVKASLAEFSKEFEDDEKVIASALNDLNSKYTKIASDYVTADNTNLQESKNYTDTEINKLRDESKLKKAATNSLGGIKIAKDNASYTVTTKTSSISGNISSGKYYGVELDSTGKAFVYVPWTDTTYSPMSAEEDNTGTEAKTISAKVLNDRVSEMLPSVMTGASSSVNGSECLVPAPTKGNQSKFLRADGTWAVPTNTTYDGDRGISLVSGKFGHSNTVNEKTAYVDTDADASISVSSNGGSFKVTYIKNDAYGHITGSQDRTITLSEPHKGTVTSVTLTQGTGITVSDSGKAITSSGSRTISLNKATTSAIGGIRVSAVSTESVSITGKIYGVQVDKDGIAYVNVPWTDNTDTKNTAGSTDKASTKMYLIGATEQNTSPQTYSNSKVYVGTDNCLYSNGTKVSVEGHTHSQYLTEVIDHTQSYTTLTGSGTTANQAIVSSGTANSWKLYTLGSAAGYSATTSVTKDSSALVTSGAVHTAIANSIAANDAMIFKGTIGTSANGATVTALPATHEVGWTYRVVTAESYAGVNCEVGDLIICITKGTAANNAHWTVAQTNIDGAVTGPTSSTDGHVAVFSGTSGKVIKNSGFTLGCSVPSDAKFTDTDTKNTAGSTKKDSTKLFLVGAASQAANLQTYSNSKVYIDTDNCLYSNGTKVSVEGHTHSYLTESGELSSNVKSGTVTQAITTSWASLVSATNMATYCPEAGTYIIQVSGTGIGISSGVFSWNTSGSTDDEILLHRTGASTNIYLRLSSRALQIAGNAEVSSRTITIKVKRVM